MANSYFFIAVFLNTMLLFIWFNTTAFYDYLKLIEIKKLFIEYEKTPPTVTYPQFLFSNKEALSNKNRVILFLIKLITCVFCLNFWTTLTVCGIFDFLMYFPVLYVATLLLYGCLKKLYNFD
jgi:hypothetical protein